MTDRAGHKAFQIAIYGKGGIGKSTISANMSAALSNLGEKVLQIGCDPKHDSTRLLLHGRTSKTVLDYMKEVPAKERTLKDIMHVGYGGVECVEAGGPEPGVGCAGRGILSTFDLLSEVGLNREDFDFIIYDVLGDVVCGGFAVPLRRGFADSVFLVTSGEYMAIYAANNILKGIRNHDGDSPRVAGILFNSRGLGSESKLVQDFARATGIPIVMSLPRSETFATAERDGMTVIEGFPGEDLAREFSLLAVYVQGLVEGKNKLYPSRPLADEQLECLLRGIPFEPDSIETRVSTPASKGVAVHHHCENLYKTKSVMKGGVLHGCAFAGSVTSTIQVKDSVTIAHGPRSCSHISSYFLSSSAIRTRSRSENERSSPAFQHLCSTDLNDISFVYGGAQELENKLCEKIREGWKVLFIVTTCPAGLIGDDVKAIAERTENAYPGVMIIPVLADGNMTGDFSQGLIDGCISVAGLIDKKISSEPGYVNLIGEKNLASNRESNHKAIKVLLDELGLHINCRFLNDSSAEAIRMFKKGGLNLIAQDDDQTLIIKRFLMDRFDAKFLPLSFPFGFRETTEWLQGIGQITGVQEKAERIIETAAVKYRNETRTLSETLSGKKVMVVSHDPQIDWVLDLISDLNMDLVRVGLLSGDDDGLPIRHPNVPAVCSYSKEVRSKDMIELRPDLVLSNYAPSGSEGTSHHDILPLCPDVGFWSGLDMAQRWVRIMRLPPMEGWRMDGVRS
ncbi:MAG: nitrogenase component 1 [Methanomassiliicoccales archaeon]|jgi:nitrogenase iron protein